MPTYGFEDLVFQLLDDWDDKVLLFRLVLKGTWLDESIDRKDCTSLIKPPYWKTDMCCAHDNDGSHCSIKYPITKIEVCYAKNVKSGKDPLTPAGLLKLVKRFEETRKLEDRARAGRPCLKEARAPCIAVEMEAIASVAASGTSSAREAARRLGLPPSSVRNILRRVLQLYQIAIVP
ncbi:hypothetical protein TNCV_4016911 [Trichonephila clavipes]|nr:hypothetical protein TNCV_4016911 [Trichonephila clavipes]